MTTSTMALSRSNVACHAYQSLSPCSIRSSLTPSRHIKHLVGSQVSTANTSVWDADTSKTSSHLYMNLLPQEEQLSLKLDTFTFCTSIDMDSTILCNASGESTIIYAPSRTKLPGDGREKATSTNKLNLLP